MKDWVVWEERVGGGGQGAYCAGLRRPTCGGASRWQPLLLCIFPCVQALENGETAISHLENFFPAHHRRSAGHPGSSNIS